MVLNMQRICLYGEGNEDHQLMAGFSYIRE
jgi:hypothetical protein